ncbi:21753_t:CDS:2, partial [Entrophospora sp. SA101]
NDGDSSLFTKTDDSSSTESTSPPRNNNDHQYEKIKSNEPEKPDNLFLCTISNQSHIVNIKAELYQYNRTIKWSNPPDNVCILPTKDDVLEIDSGIRRVLFWTCQLNNENYIYRGK